MQQQNMGCRSLVVFVGVRLRLAAVPSLLGGRRREVSWAAQLGALRFLGGQRVLRPFRNGLTLVLGENGKNAHGKGVRIRHVAADEIHPRIAELEDKSRVPRQPVELGNKQRRPRRPSRRDSCQQLRPLVSLARFHFDKLPHQVRRLGEGRHRRPLGFEAEAGLALLLGGDSQVGDVGFHE